MNWKINLMAISLVFTSCLQDEYADAVDSDPTYLIEAQDLLTIIDRSHIKVLDFRKKEKYASEHIPGAMHIWRGDIEDPSFAYGGIMASPKQVESLFSKLGIGSNDTVIIYDDNGLCNASRLWWILQNYDFNKVKLLHGGLDAWKKAGGTLTNELTRAEPMIFTLDPNVSMRYYVSVEEMKEGIAEQTVILDTRTRDEFSGKRQKKGAAKGGRIPGGIHLDWADAINYNSDQKLKPLNELETMYSHLAQSKDEPIIVYCHSGVRSAHTTFILTQLLGYTNVKNYDGSWTEWSHFDGLPVQQDSLTQIEF